MTTTTKSQTINRDRNTALDQEGNTLCVQMRERVLCAKSPHSCPEEIRPAYGLQFKLRAIEILPSDDVRMRPCNESNTGRRGVLGGIPSADNKMGLQFGRDIRGGRKERQ